MGSQVKMSWKKRDDTGLLWAVIVLLIGTTILIGPHGVYKGIQLDLLHEEVRELRYQLNKLQVKERLNDRKDKLICSADQKCWTMPIMPSCQILTQNCPSTTNGLEILVIKMSMDCLNIIKSAPLGLGMTILTTTRTISLLVRNSIRMMKATEDTECLKLVEMTTKVILWRYPAD